MTRLALPEPVAHFIDASIQSVSDLETLLWIRSRRDGPVAQSELERGLGMVPWQLGLVLGRLVDRGLVAPAGRERWSYLHADTSVEDVLDWLAENLGRFRVAVIRQIFAEPIHAEEDDH